MSEALGAACDHDCAVIVSDEDWHRSEGVCEGCGVRMKNYTETGWGPLLPFGDVPCGSRVGECCPPHKFTNEGAPDVCDTCGAPPHSTPPPTREPIRLTAEELALLRGHGEKWAEDAQLGDLFAEPVESILAARLAGGPTLADARTPIAQEIEATVWRDGHGKPCTPFDEGKAAAARIARGNYIADARTPESEDTE